MITMGIKETMQDDGCRCLSTSVSPLPERYPVVSSITGKMELRVEPLVMTSNFLTWLSFLNLHYLMLCVQNHSVV